MKQLRGLKGYERILTPLRTNEELAIEALARARGYKPISPEPIQKLIPLASEGIQQSNQV